MMSTMMNTSLINILPYHLWCLVLCCFVLCYVVSCCAISSPLPFPPLPPFSTLFFCTDLLSTHLYFSAFFSCHLFFSLISFPLPSHFFFSSLFFSFMQKGNPGMTCFESTCWLTAPLDKSTFYNFGKLEFCAPSSQPTSIPSQPSSRPSSHPSR